MVIDPDAVVVGPQFTTGSVTRTITSMVSVGAPRHIAAAIVLCVMQL
jgi:hypothetical protein